MNKGLGIFSVLLVMGCSTGHYSDLESYVEQVKAREVGGISALPLISTAPKYIYDETKLRDPFAIAPVPGARQVIDACPSISRERHSLEQFPLDTLSLVGILEQSANRWALIRTQDGEVYRVSRDDYIGQNDGRIIDITETDITLIEKLPDKQLGCIERQANLTSRH